MTDLITTWMDFIEYLALEWPEKHINRTWIKLDKKFLDVKEVLKEDIFLTCKYQNPVLKMTQLEAQYLDKQSLEKALILLGQGTQDQIEVSLIGEAKKGSASNRKHCLHSIKVDFSIKKAHLKFRSSDIIKKFLTDIFFVQQKVLRVMGATDFEINCSFDSVMLRSPFWFIYLDQYGDKYGEAALRNRIEKMDPITVSWLRYYSRNLDKDINYKSLDRGRDRMEESKWWSVYKDYIMGYKSK